MSFDCVRGEVGNGAGSVEEGGRGNDAMGRPPVSVVGDDCRDVASCETSDSRGEGIVSDVCDDCSDGASHRKLLNLLAWPRFMPTSLTKLSSNAPERVRVRLRVRVRVGNRAWVRSLAQSSSNAPGDEGARWRWRLCRWRGEPESKGVR